MPQPPKRRSTRKARKPKRAASKSPGLADYAASTVRPHEEGSRLTRYRQTLAADLVLRFCKYVAVAQSRTASGVASKIIRVYMRKQPGRKTAWDTRPIARKELARQRARAGYFTRKAADLSDDVDEVVDPLHPLVKLLSEPNPLFGAQAMFEQTQLGVGLTGDSYWHVVRDGGGVPVEVWPLAPQFMRPLPSRSNMVDAYVYGRGTENEVTLDAEEVIRFTQPNPRGDPFKGFGDLEKCLDAADLSVAFDQYRLNTIDNGAQPGLIVIDKKGGIEQRQQLEDQINRKFGGMAKVGRSMVLTGEVEIQPWGMSEKEVSFLNSDVAVRETIANCHDLPVALLTLDSAALATAKAAIPQWELMGLKPRCDRFADTLNRLLVPMFGDERLYVCYEEVVTRDMEAAAVRVVALYGSDIITKNEARAELDYDAVPDGDQFRSESMPEPDPFGLGGATRVPDSEPGMDSEPDSEDEPDDSEGERPEAEKSSAPTIIIHNNGSHATAARPRVGILSQKALMLSGEALTCCAHAPRSVRKDANEEWITLTERQLEGLIRSWFTGLPTEIIPKLNTRGLPTNTVDTIAQSFRTLIENPLAVIFTRGYNFGVQELPTPGAAQIMAALTGPVEAYLRQYEGKLIRSVSSTIDEQIRTDLADGIAAGESIPQLSARLTNSVNSMSGAAAEAIARTETSRAFQTSRIGAWKESGTVWGKRWQLAPDACEFCVAASQEYGVKPLDEPFFTKGTILTGAFGGQMKLDYADVEVANLHPNDRCDIVFVREPPQ